MNFKENELKLSNNVHVFSKNGVVSLFHTLNMSKVYGQSKLLQIIERFKNPINRKRAESEFTKTTIDKLAESGFLIENNDHSKEENFLADKHREIGKIDITNLVLLVSNACNLKCSYCQIEENIKEKEHMINMSREVADKAIDLFKKSSRVAQKKTVSITGGEPLLNIDVVKYIVERVNEEISNVRVVVFTNGVGITTELAEFFKKNKVLLLVSLDGPRDMHNQVRKLKSGKGSFDKTMQGFNILQATGCDVGISAVGGNHNIQVIDETFKFFLELNPPSIGFNFSHFLIEKENPTEIPISEFGKILIRFYEVLREKNIFLENISRPIDAFVKNVPKVNECQAQGRGFTVDARGKIGPCKSLVVSDVFSKNIDSVQNIDSVKMFQEWATRSPLTDQDCQFCPAIMICGGGCAYDSYIANRGDYLKMDKRICEYKLNILDYLIWDLYDKVSCNVKADSLYFPTIQDQEAALNCYFDSTNPLQRSVGHETDVAS